MSIKPNLFLILLPLLLTGDLFGQVGSIPVTLNVLEQVTISPREDGFILVSKALAGNSVAQDSVIVELDPHAVDLEIKKASIELQALQLLATDQSQINEATARRCSAHEYVAGLARLSSKTSFPRMDMVRAQAELDEFDAQLSGANLRFKRSKFDSESKQAELNLLEFRKENMKILSPFAGSIAEVFKFKGDFVFKGESIAVIYRLDTLAGVALIKKEDLYPAEAYGRQIRLKLKEGIEQMASIERVSPRIDASGMYRVYFEIQNTESRPGQWDLLPGMTISGTLLPKDEIAISK